MIEKEREREKNRDTRNVIASEWSGKVGNRVKVKVKNSQSGESIVAIEHVRVSARWPRKEVNESRPGVRARYV